MRSCVIGRAVGIFSSSSAMALASGDPTQIDSERLSSSSRRTIIGMLDSGSNTRFLTFISSHMASPPRELPRPAPPARHGGYAAAPR